MNLKFFCVVDTKTGIYNMPFLARTEAEAVRSFDFTINSDDEAVPFLYAEDFFLYQIGEFDQDTGVITPCEHKSICSGLSVRRSLVPAFDSGAPASQTPTPQASNTREADK